MELKLFYTIVIFFFGLIFGSFYNVVGWRLPIGLSIVRPSGSFCPKCRHKLRWYENIPVFSFLIQGGKCRKCKEKISKFYITIELLTGILFALSYYLLGFSFNFFLALIVSSFFVIVLVSDLKFLVIPDEVTVFLTLLLFVVRVIFYGFGDAFHFLLYGFIAFICMYSLMLLGNFLFKKESLGGGDIKLMFFIGCCIGPWMSFVAIFLSSVLAIPFALIVILFKKENIIPFGPFLLASCLILVLSRLNIDKILDIIMNIGI